jgi:transcriptional regulator with XRE-family HTH domain
MSLDSQFEALGLSDADVAARLNVSAEAVRLWRRGKRRMKPSLARAAERELGISVSISRPDLWPPVVGTPAPAEAA